MEMKNGEQEPKITEQYEAMISGLGMRNPQYICAAAYLSSELDDEFPVLSGDYEWDGGNGVTSQTVTRGLAFMLPNAGSNTYDEDYPDEVETGRILAGYGNLPEMALHLYRENNPSPDESRTWNRVSKDLDAKSAELERDLTSLKRSLNS